MIPANFLCWLWQWFSAFLHAFCTSIKLLTYSFLFAHYASFFRCLRFILCLNSYLDFCFLKFLKYFWVLMRTHRIIAYFVLWTINLHLFCLINEKSQKFSYKTSILRNVYKSNYLTRCSTQLNFLNMNIYPQWIFSHPFLLAIEKYLKNQYDLKWYPSSNEGWKF